MKKNLEKRMNKCWGWYKDSNIDYSLEDLVVSYKECEELVDDAFRIEFVSYEEYDECKEILDKYLNVIEAVAQLEGKEI